MQLLQKAGSGRLTVKHWFYCTTSLQPLDTAPSGHGLGKPEQCLAHEVARRCQGQAAAHSLVAELQIAFEKAEEAG
ncbi:hypothetical protein D9M68_844710 [compost metagenome]